jgi:hypothetical protein
MKSPLVVRQLMKSFSDASTSTAKQPAKTTSAFLCLDTTNQPHLTAWPNLFPHLSVHEATSIITQIKKFDYIIILKILEILNSGLQNRSGLWCSAIFCG